MMIRMHNAQLEIQCLTALTVCMCFCARDLEMTVMGSQGHSSPRSNPSAIGSAPSHNFVQHAAAASSLAGSATQQSPVSDLAEIRVSVEDMPQATQPRSVSPAKSSLTSNHDLGMVDISLTDSPIAHHHTKK